MPSCAEGNNDAISVHAGEGRLTSKPLSLESGRGPFSFCVTVRNYQPASYSVVSGGKKHVLGNMDYFSRLVLHYLNITVFGI